MTVRLATWTFQRIPNYLHKLSGKVGNVFQGNVLSGKVIVRERSCPGNVLSGKRLVRETSVRESDCPWNVRYPFICLVHRQNTLPNCSHCHSMCKNDHSRDACTTLFVCHNQAVLDPSWCRSSQTYLLTSLSRQTWTHCSGLYAVQPSRRAFHRDDAHSSQSVLSENIPHPRNRLVNSNAELTRYN